MSSCSRKANVLQKCFRVIILDATQAHIQILPCMEIS